MANQLGKGTLEGSYVTDMSTSTNTPKAASLACSSKIPLATARHRGCLISMRAKRSSWYCHTVGQNHMLPLLGVLKQML